MGLRSDVRWKRSAFLFFIPLVLLYSVSYFERMAVPGTIFNELSCDLALTASQVAAIGSSYVYVYAIAQIFSGMLIDKYCGARIALAGGLVFTIGAIMMPLCADVRTVYLSRVFQGLGASTLYLSFINEIDRSFGRRNFAVFLSVAFFIGNVGGMFGTVPFERLCRLFSWQNVLFVTGIASLVLYFLIVIGRRNVQLPPVRKEKMSFKGTFEIVRSPLAWGLTFCSCTNFCVFFVIQSVFGKKFLEDCGNMSSPSAASVMFFAALISMCTALASGFMTRSIHNGRKPFIVASVVATFSSTLLMTGVLFFGLPGHLFVVGYFLYAFSAGFCLIFTMAMQEYNGRSMMTQSAALLNMVCYFIAAAGARITGIVLDFFGGVVGTNGAMIYPREAYLSVFLAVLAISAVSLVLSFFLPETRGHYVKRGQT